MVVGVSAIVHSCTMGRWYSVQQSIAVRESNDDNNTTTNGERRRTTNDDNDDEDDDDDDDGIRGRRQRQKQFVPSDPLPIHHPFTRPVVLLYLLRVFIL